MRDKCNKCMYSCPVDVGDDNKMMRACAYILVRYEKRPCPPGKDCTVFRPAARGKNTWL